MKQTIRINENQLQQIVAESVKKVLNEGFGNRVNGAIQGFKQGGQQMAQQAGNYDIASGDAVEAAQGARKAIQMIQQGNAQGAIKILQNIINNIKDSSQDYSQQFQGYTGNGRYGFGE